ncbi:hypothetical protein JZ751_016396 [Albula glossodonta]|uniref:Superoxide dismutase [Cu-Zn] n=1 Tax=Albula glossodonta TaxID=121402 RepID=A0A8T2NQL6_9TELE|nr:hypothetical protein JZ751_016396 [Albula glossodonta]
MSRFSCPLLLVFIGLIGCGSENYAGTGRVTPPEADEFNGTLYATCKMRPSTKLPVGQPKVYGHVLFRQDGPEEELQVLFNLHGFPAVERRVRAIHIHQYGDLSDGCDATGGHYNPQGVAHPGHPGDFGNFLSRQGRVNQRITARQGATLFGGLSVLGRAVVIHEKEDDLGRGGDAGSLLHGNAGRRLACCVIGISNQKLWERTTHQQLRRRT